MVVHYRHGAAVSHPLISPCFNNGGAVVLQGSPGGPPGSNGEKVSEHESQAFSVDTCVVLLIVKWNITRCFSVNSVS